MDGRIREEVVAGTQEGGVGEEEGEVMMNSREIPAKQQERKKDNIAEAPVMTTKAETAAGRNAYGLGYVSFLCIGFNSLVNWVFVIQTLPFIAKTQLDGEDWNNTLLGSFQAVEVLVLLCMLRLGSTSVVGVCATGIINAIVAVIFPLLTVTGFSGKLFRVIILHVLCVILGMCSAVLQGSGFALAAVMPKNFVGAVSAGQGLAGAFTFAIVTGASFLLFDIETVKGTQALVWLVFSIAAVTSLACTALFFSAMKQSWAAAALREVAVAAARRKCSAAEIQKEILLQSREETEDDKLVNHTNKDMKSSRDDSHLAIDRSPAAVAAASAAAAATDDAAAVKTRPLFPTASSSSASTFVSSTTAAATAAGEIEPQHGRGGRGDRMMMRMMMMTKDGETEKHREGATTSSGGRVVTNSESRRHQQQQDVDLEQQEGEAEVEEEGSRACEVEKVRTQLTRWGVLKQATPWLCVLMMHMAITFHLYPKVGPLSWHYNKPVVKNHLVVLFGLFCAAESIGRFLPDLRSFQWPWSKCKYCCSSSSSSKASSSSASTSGRSSSSSSSSHAGNGGDETNGNSNSSSSDNEKSCLSWLMLSRRALVASELARLLLFIPFILGYALSNVPFINSFGWYCCLIIILALTQGWMGTLAFFYSVTSVDDAEAKKFTGPMAAIASPLGCVIGLYTAAPY